MKLKQKDLLIHNIPVGRSPRGQKPEGDVMQIFLGLFTVIILDVVEILIVNESVQIIGKIIKKVGELRK